MTLYKEIMPYINKKIHVHGFNLGRLRTPTILQLVSLGTFKILPKTMVTGLLNPYAASG